MASITANIMESIMATMEKNKPKNKWKELMLLFVVGAVVALVVLIVGYVRKNQAMDMYEQLAEQTNLTAGDTNSKPQKQENGSGESESKKEKDTTHGATAESNSATEIITVTPQPIATPNPNYEKDITALKEMGINIPEKNIDFEDLTTKINADIYAWIYIPDTNVDYPVLQHPTDNSYYLERNMDGSKGYPGCIYTENYNTKDFQDPSTVLYGHNMMNGTMFAGLHQFADEEYLLQHPYVYIYTPERLLVYEIFSSHEYTNEHLLKSKDMTSEGVFRNFLDEITQQQSMSHYVKSGVEVTTDDKIITLSTCVKNKADKRYLVHGVLINEN